MLKLQVQVKMNFILYTLLEQTKLTRTVNVNVNGKELEMDIDTGASVTVFNDNTYKIIKQEAELTPVKGHAHT